MSKNKKYVYLQLYPKDLMADEKLAKCDKANAWGAYLALLNIMAMEPIRGCLRLCDWDTHPNNERHSLVLKFRKAKSLHTKSVAFSRVVSQCTPLKVSQVAEGIEQLLTFGVLVMYDDALIQPRMFRDSNSQLEGYNPEPEDSEIEPIDMSNKNNTNIEKKENKKQSLALAPALRANMRMRIESENINNNSKEKKGGMGENTATVNRTDIPTGDYSFSEFWLDYDKQVAETQCEALWESISPSDREAIRAYISKYKQAQPNKRFRKNPVTFLRERAWEDEIINETTVSKGQKQNTATVLHTEASEYDNIEQW